jgi:phage gp16-like protein
MTSAAQTRALARPASAGGTRAAEIKLIHIGRSALHLAEDDYRALVAGVAGGKTSSKDLTDAERAAVLARMKALGFEVKPRKPATGAGAVALIREAQLRKLRAMWYALADLSAVATPDDVAGCNAAIEAWAKSRLPHLRALRFATGEDMGELIEQMKQWCRRVGAELR